MKVVFVVDTISNIKSKIDLVKSHFGDDICFVVKAHFSTLFQSFGYNCHAVYSNNLAGTIHALLLNQTLDDIVICNASVALNSDIIKKFITTIGDGTKVVNVLPKYNAFERMCNGAYNVYVNSLFKSKDSMISPKLQYLPTQFVTELLATHFGNKLFEVDAEFVRTLYIEEKEINKTLKVKTKFNKFHIIPIISALLITLALLLTIAFAKVSYVLIITFVALYILDIFIAIIYQCKLYFDARFIR